jgi:hypothetical protein
VLVVDSEDQDLQLELLNHTQALDAWWAELGDRKASLQCACSDEGEDCRCMEDSDMSSSAGSNATTVEGANGSTVSEALRNETEHLVSLWFVVHTGGYRRGWGYGGYRRGWGWGGCRHVGYTGSAAGTTAAIAAVSAMERAVEGGARFCFHCTAAGLGTLDKAVAPFERAV